MWKHTREHPNTCRVCSATFEESSSLTKHMWRHTGGLPHTLTCKTCSLVLHLHRRVFWQHIFKDISLCEHVYASFTLSSILTNTRHVLKHVGKHSFPCKMCSATFHGLVIWLCASRSQVEVQNQSVQILFGLCLKMLWQIQILHGDNYVTDLLKFCPLQVHLKDQGHRSEVRTEVSLNKWYYAV